MIPPGIGTLTNNLTEEVGARIEEFIFEGHFSPGEQLKEAELAEKLQVSRSTVREALRRIEMHGLVTILPNRGAFVRNVSLKEEIDIFDLRAELSAYAARMTTDRMTPAIEERLKALIAEMEAAIEISGAMYYSVNLQFHDYIMSESGNRRATQFYRTLVRESYYNRRRVSLMTKALMRRSLAEHKKIVDAMIAGDTQLAVEYSYKHVMDGKARLISGWHSPSDSSPSF